MSTSRFWIVLALVFVLNFLATSEFWSLFIAMDDEAVTILGATRLLQGELPYRDWDTRHTPGSYFLSALLFSVVGPDAPWPRVLFSLISATTAVVIQLISFRSLPAGVRYLPAFLFTSFGVLGFPILSYHWLGSLCVVVSLWSIVRWQQHSTPASAGTVGVALACSCWCLQSAGLTSILLAGAVAGRYRPRHGRWLLLTMVGFSLLLWAPLLPYPGQIWQASVVNITRHLSFNYVGYSWRWLVDEWQAMPAFSPGTKVWHVLALGDEILLTCFVYASIYALAVAGVVWGEIRRRQGKSQAGEETLAWALLLWLLVTRAQQAVLYIGFLGPVWVLVMSQMLARVPRSSWVVASIVGLESLGWSLRWALRREAFVYPIETRAGAYLTNNPALAAQMHYVSQWMTEIPPGTRVLAFPFLTSYYTLYHLQNPIPEPVLQPFLYSDQAYQRCLQVLTDKQVPWLLIHSAENNLGNDEFTRKTRPEMERRVAQLTVDYTAVRSFYALKLYQRKPLR